MRAAFASLLLLPASACAQFDRADYARCERDLPGLWRADDGSLLQLRIDHTLSVRHFQLFPESTAVEPKKLVDTEGSWGPFEPNGNNVSWYGASASFALNLNANPSADFAGQTSTLFVECGKGGPTVVDWLGDPDDPERRAYRKQP